MSQEGWGLNSWFAEGKQKTLKSGRVSLEGAGYIHQLKWELQQRLSGKGTSAVKAKGMDAHLDAQALYEKKALDVVVKRGISQKDAKMYIDFYSKPQRERNYEEWEKVSEKWHNLNTGKDANGKELIDDETKMLVSAFIDGYNKATKFVEMAMDKADTKQTTKDARSLEWVSDMIVKCDEMIALIDKADPSFKNNKLRNT